MPSLSPQALTKDEQEAILAASVGNPRDHVIISMALGTGLRLAEIVGLNSGDVYLPNGEPRIRIRLRAAIAKGGRSSDIFLPDALVHKFDRFRTWKVARMESVAQESPLFCNASGSRSAASWTFRLRCVW